MKWGERGVLERERACTRACALSCAPCVCPYAGVDVDVASQVSCIFLITREISCKRKRLSPASHSPSNNRSEAKRKARPARASRERLALTPASCRVYRGTLRRGGHGARQRRAERRRGRGCESHGAQLQAAAQRGAQLRGPPGHRRRHALARHQGRLRVRRWGPGGAEVKRFIQTASFFGQLERLPRLKLLCQ